MAAFGSLIQLLEMSCETQESHKTRGMLRTAYGWLFNVENGFPVSDGFFKDTCHSEVEERNSKSFLLDVAATDANHEAHMITDGLAGAEGRVLPILGLLCKSRREESFPVDLLQKGLSVDLEAARATRLEDKTRILNSIAFPRSRTAALSRDVPTEHQNYANVNRALASHFALASLESSYRTGHDPSNLLRALHLDGERRLVQLSLTGCRNFDDLHLQNLLNHMPCGLQSLRLDLAYTGVASFDNIGDSLAFAPNLKTLVLRCTGSLRSMSGLSALMCPSLRHLELWFSNLPDLTDIHLGSGNEALWKLHLEELVLYVQGCSMVPQSSKKAL